MQGRDDASSPMAGTADRAGIGAGSGSVNDGIYGGPVYPGVLPAVPDGALPVIPDKDRRSNAATAASAAGVRALSAQALQFYFRAPVKAFFRTRVDYLAYARGPDGRLTGNTLSSPSSTSRRLHYLRNWLRGTTPGVLTMAIKRYGWSVVPDQVLPPLIANIGVAAVLYTSYLHILGELHPESAQARRRVYPPPAPSDTFAAGFLAGSIQSIVAAPLDAIQARYDHRSDGAIAATNSNGKPQSMWTFSANKLREIGLRGIFAGWGLSFLKDSLGSAVFFSVFEYVKAQGYYHFVAYYYGALDGSMILAAQKKQQMHDDATRQMLEHRQGHRQNEPVHRHHPRHHHDGPLSPPPLLSAAAGEEKPVVIHPHYALEPLFLLLAGVAGSLCQQVLLHPLTHLQAVHWDLLEDLDDAAKSESKAAAAAARAHSQGTAVSAPLRRVALLPLLLLPLPRFHVVRSYYHAYQETWRRCRAQAVLEGRTLTAWLYRGFWWNSIRQVPSTSAGLIIFELARRKYGLAGEEVRISQDGYDILLA